jgi:hypothetical protein
MAGGVETSVLYRRDGKEEKMKSSSAIGRLAVILVLTGLLSGCVLTKIVTVPMRAVGAIVSVVPVAGNVAHAGIDTAAEGIDLLPF